MGYDYDECLICYLNGCGRNPTKRWGNVCFSCLTEVFTNGPSTGRVVTALNGLCCFAKFKTCSMCGVTHENEQLGVHVRVCSECQGCEPSDDDCDSY